MVFFPPNACLCIGVYTHTYTHTPSSFLLYLVPALYFDFARMKWKLGDFSEEVDKTNCESLWCLTTYLLKTLHFLISFLLLLY